METSFLPSAKRAINLRSSMSTQLLSSLKSQLKVASNSINKSPATDSHSFTKDPYARPIDFVAYFDLITLSSKQNSFARPLEIDSVTDFALESLTHLLGVKPGFTSMPAGPKISTLSLDYYKLHQIQSLIRWWDMEPNNSLQLTAVKNDLLIKASANIHLALNQLELSAPQMHQEVVIIISDIVLASSGKDHKMEFGGISSFCSWGSICLNEARHQHWADYYKKIVHECSHLVLFAIARNEPLVLNSDSEKFSSPLRDDPRPVDGLYHAAFVSAREAMALEACIAYLENPGGDSQDLLTIEKLEKLLNSSVLAFWDCCEQLNNHAVLSSLGKAILNDTKQYMIDTFDVLNISE